MRKRLFLLAAAVVLGNSQAWALSLQEEQTDGEQEPLAVLQPERPDKEDLFFMHDSLFDTYIETDYDKARELYYDRAPFKLPPDHLLDISSRTVKDLERGSTTLLTYLFRNYISNYSVRSFDIPIVIDSYRYHNVNAYENFYRNGMCAGMTYLEADLKYACKLDAKNNYGLIETSYTPKLNLKKQRLQIKQIPDNSDTSSFSYKIYHSFPVLIGLWSNVKNGKFKLPETTFDKHLYFLGKKIAPGMSLKELKSKCKSKKTSLCEPVFSGNNTAAVLGNDFYVLAPTKDKVAKASGLPISFGQNGRVYLMLDNTLLSDSKYVNYGFYTEAELAVLKDLGYDINAREFFGSSVYGSGTFDNPKFTTVNSGYFAWDSKTQAYDNSKASSVPLGVGTHIYGNYNEVTQLYPIASIGYGAVGVRIDGHDNKFILPPKTTVIENGYEASGIAVAYGKNHILNIEGTVSAEANSGTGILMGFGSNLQSDLLEYRGSYQKVRTYNIATDKYNNKDKAQYPVDNELMGPLVEELNISGDLKGGRAAILIYDNAFVKEINLLNNANIKGNIRSYWNPYVLDGTIYATTRSGYIAPPKIQLPSLLHSDLNAKELKSLLPSLYTKVNIGVKQKGNEPYSSGTYISPDHVSKTYIEGDLSGSSMDVRVLGGIASVNGTVNINSLIVSDSVLHLNFPQNKTSFIKEISLQKGADFDLGNGVENHIIVNDCYLSGNSVLRVDADKDGRLIDKIIATDKFAGADGQINVEPSLSYADVKSISSNPKELLSFVNGFIENANSEFGRYGISIRFPRHIWFNNGYLGRKLKCSARGCYIGDYVSSFSKSAEELPRWRIYLSAFGILVLGLCTFIYLKLSGGSEKTRFN